MNDRWDHLRVKVKGTNSLTCMRDYNSTSIFQTKQTCNTRMIKLRTRDKIFVNADQVTHKAAYKMEKKRARVKQLISQTNDI
jgi:hypothetical protein